MDTKRLVEMLRLHEGVKDKPYKCTSGKTTIGVGRNIEDSGLSPDEIDHLLLNDIKRVEQELGQFEWFTVMNNIRQTAIADMCFNLGLPRLLQFKNMIAALQQQDYAMAAVHMMDSRWARQVGQRAARLSKIIQTGKYVR